MKLELFKVDPAYLRFLHKIDSRVSVKFNNRPFVGVLTMINGMKYVLPLTSQTTEERKKRGKKRRKSVLTTFIKQSDGLEIANILHNNMIPVIDEVIEPISIDAKVDSYLANEIRFIRKNSEGIIEKASNVYNRRVSKYNDFYMIACCDFEQLERKMGEFFQS